MTVISITAKCSDMFSASLDKDNTRVGEYDGYVPGWMPSLPGENHYGDYIELQIDIDTGQILNWKRPSNEQLAETFKEPE